ncbi:response regulator transcription factor [Quadrisphaera setariae]|uniref:Response regulator transcription factor n=1 Tax=Quadrisphaera setariae TaxID=2593304 RepID=A0A5C8ZD85_9ACTN|nr:response regulator transcription factor [Quadrisphaera setariae]TXR55121.1 response regulator transcription factor [Quadrisphaera setariae]
MPAAAARALVVEDDASVREALVEALRSDGFVVEALPDGEGFEGAVDAFRPDVALLDVMLPGLRDGFALARALRERSDAGLLFLTARDAVDDRLRGFSTGADDYVVKPYVTAELLARVRALLQRLGRVPSTVQVGDLVLDEASSVATRGGHVLDLTGTEHRLLAYLVAGRGRTLSKTQILTQVWGYEDYDPNLVEVHVSALRRKTEAHGPRLIHTVRGLGYVLRP